MFKIPRLSCNMTSVACGTRLFYDGVTGITSFFGISLERFALSTLLYIKILLPVRLRQIRITPCHSWWMSNHIQFYSIRLPQSLHRSILLHSKTIESVTALLLIQYKEPHIPPPFRLWSTLAFFHVKPWYCVATHQEYLDHHFFLHS